MDTHELTIEFRGICSHFRNTVPGVPHRVVLPQTAVLRPGQKITPQHPDPESYVLEPHWGHVSYEAESQIHQIDVPGAIRHGRIHAGVRLQIANASRDEGLDYPDYVYPPNRPFKDLPRLAEYVTQYRYSDDVLYGGRAQCYFDLFRGTVAVRPNGMALWAVVRLKTEGTPRLQVTRLDRQSVRDPIFDDVTLPPGATLVVGNTSWHCKVAHNHFLWHLLTTEGSIPERLPREPYGSDESKPDLDAKTATERFSELLAHGFADPSALPPDRGTTETDASCSNSQWP